jgi:hypothetical protein
MPLVQTRGAASAQGFGEFSQPAAAANYIEDVFQTWLYTGNGSSQTIPNGVDLSTKGGLVWIKSRTETSNHQLVDTARGRFAGLNTNTTNSEDGNGLGGGNFLSNGFSVSYIAAPSINTTSQTYCSWTFREQPKFFDIVTYTGNGVTTGRTISHNLGSAPGMIILKVTNLAGDDWYVYHRSIPTRVLALNSSNSTNPTTPATIFGNGTTVVAPTSTEFTIGGTANQAYTYVVYLFAHDAGGFGLSGTDNVISCGSFNTDGSGNATVSLGYEPQYLMFKRTDSAGNWNVADVMRGFSLASNEILQPNTSGSGFSANWGNPTATGFIFDEGNLAPSATFIYMAIRRGPMKVPTTGTQVFNPATGLANGARITTGFVSDLLIWNYLPGYGLNSLVNDRLRGVSTTSTYGSGTNLSTALNAAEATTQQTQGWDNTGITTTNDSSVWYNFSRRAGFFDQVCYTGTGSNTTQAHNLTVVPELMIVKRRDGIDNWTVYAQPLGNTSRIFLNSSNAVSTGQTTTWNSTTPTSSVFSIGTNTGVNASGGTFVNYLFATLAGVSKVGSYTGTGTTQTINCGFTGGARFVLIKRTDSTGDWYVWDTARGIISGNDPYLLLNTTDAQVTNTDFIDPASSGFEISSTAPAAINASGGSFIFLAIA